MNRASPFSGRAALALVVGGAVMFVALLWVIGAGVAGANFNDGGGHAGGRGLNGYAGLNALLLADSYETPMVRGKTGVAQPGLLILTPAADASGGDIAGIVARHRAYGPVLVITPKWSATRLPADTPDAKAGWVALGGAIRVVWSGWLDDIGLDIAPLRTGTVTSDTGAVLTLPVPARVQSGRVVSDAGDTLTPIITSVDGGRILAAQVTDKAAGQYPLVMVFEPDLLNNYGLARQANAQWAEALIHRMTAGGPRRAAFDLTLNGFARHANLLTLAFTPPYLAATLCLLLAAVAAGWRAFVRFGPPAAPTRAIAFGKRALVENGAAIIRRSGRLHLIAAPYEALLRERLLRLAGISRQGDIATQHAAIDRAVALRTAAQRSLLVGGKVPRFTPAADRLRAIDRTTHKPEPTLLAAARELYENERIWDR